jgi:hypothetical protein
MNPFAATGTSSVRGVGVYQDKKTGRQITMMLSKTKQKRRLFNLTLNLIHGGTFARKEILTLICHD